MKTKTPNKTILLVSNDLTLGKEVVQIADQNDIPLTVCANAPRAIKNFKSLTSSVLQGHPGRTLDENRDLGNVHTIISILDQSIERKSLFDMCTAYRANSKLVHMAKAKGVKKIICVAPRTWKLQTSKEVIAERNTFFRELKTSGVDYTIISTNGIFTDYIDFLHMATFGKIYLLGNGKQRFNPIHVRDLVDIIFEAITTQSSEICAGGPEVLSPIAIAEKAFKALDKPVNIVHVPRILGKIFYKKTRLTKNLHKLFPVNSCIPNTTFETIASAYGSESLDTFFKEKAKSLHRIRRQLSFHMLLA